MNMFDQRVLLVRMLMWSNACLNLMFGVIVLACALQITLVHFSRDTHVMALLQQKQTFEFAGLVQIQR